MKKQRARLMFLTVGAASLVGTALIAGILASLPTVAPAAEKNEVNLYSYRQPGLIKPFLDEFTKRTGIKVNVTVAEKGMLERLKAEGRNTPADMVLTTDIGRLSAIADAEMLRPVKSEVLERNIPAHYRDPKGVWFGLSVRARVLFVSKDRVRPGEITSYEQLTDPKWRGRICTRSGKHVYNISMLAAVIAEKGEAEAQKWAAGVRENLARKPQGNDRAQAKAIAEGVCDVAIANTYYMALMTTNKKSPEQQKWAAATRVVFPDLNGHGTHVNISGAAVTEHAKHPANAVKLLEFLSEDFAQQMYADQNFEYPVKAGVPLNDLVASWGKFKPSTLEISKVAKFRPLASRIMDRVQFNK
ncbi:MAG: Fe(3+) ABC transporter substrate-binding protein [Proteobacteria bacterium]|nr:Fe(3+) ABC transporter substrate-binding protein [Pseudomonadota bacterium]